MTKKTLQNFVNFVLLLLSGCAGKVDDVSAPADPHSTFYDIMDECWTDDPPQAASTDDISCVDANKHFFECGEEWREADCNNTDPFYICRWKCNAAASCEVLNGELGEAQYALQDCNKVCDCQDLQSYHLQCGGQADFPCERAKWTCPCGYVRTCDGVDSWARCFAKFPPKDLSGSRRNGRLNRAFALMGASFEFFIFFFAVMPSDGILNVSGSWLLPLDQTRDERWGQEILPKRAESLRGRLGNSSQRPSFPLWRHLFGQERCLIGELNLGNCRHNPQIRGVIELGLVHAIDNSSVTVL